MGFLQALLMAAVQGLTEFLPVSSSAHLVLTKELLGVEVPGALWETALHLGTLIAVVIVFRRDAADAVKGLAGGLAAARRGESWRAVWSANADFRMAAFVVVGSIPAGVVGVVFKDRIESLFSNPAAALAMLFITGEILWLTHRWSAVQAEGRMRMSDSVIVGVAQACALLPGISRSGSTIGAGLLRGVERRQAARFSFLLSIPAICGAAAIEMSHVDALPAGEAPVMAAAVVVSSAVGFAALKALLRVVEQGRLHWFAWYCWGVGLAGLTLLWGLGRV